MNARDTLSELVALEDLKTKIERGVCASDRYPDGLINGFRTHEEHVAAMVEYDRRKPIAWANARAVLAQQDDPAELSDGQIVDICDRLRMPCHDPLTTFDLIAFARAILAARASGKEMTT